MTMIGRVVKLQHYARGREIAAQVDGKKYVRPQRIGGTDQKTWRLLFPKAPSTQGNPLSKELLNNVDGFLIYTLPIRVMTT